MLTIISILGLGGIGTLASLAGAWFLPGLRRYLLIAAAVAAGVTFLYGKGVHDEKARRDANEAALNSKVDRAVIDALQSKEKDPFDDPKH